MLQFTTQRTKTFLPVDPGAQAAERNSNFLQALQKTGRKFEDAGRGALLAERNRERALPPRPVNIAIGSAGELCADSPLAGF